MNIVLQLACFFGFYLLLHYQITDLYSEKTPCNHVPRNRPGIDVLITLHGSNP